MSLKSALISLVSVYLCFSTFCYMDILFPLCIFGSALFPSWAGKFTSGTSIPCFFFSDKKFRMNKVFWSPKRTPLDRSTPPTLVEPAT